MRPTLPNRRSFTRGRNTLASVASPRKRGYQRPASARQRPPAARQPAASRPPGVWEHHPGHSVWTPETAAPEKPGYHRPWWWWHRLNLTAVAVVVGSWVAAGRTAQAVHRVVPPALTWWPVAAGVAGTVAGGWRIPTVHRRVVNLRVRALAATTRVRARVITVGRRARHRWERCVTIPVIRQLFVLPVSTVCAATKWWFPVAVLLRIPRVPTPNLAAQCVIGAAAVTVLVRDRGRMGVVTRDVTETVWGRRVRTELRLGAAQLRLEQALCSARVPLSYFNPTLTDLTETGWGVRYRGVIRGGATVAELAARTENIASAFHVGTGRVRVSGCNPNNATQFVLEVRNRDPLTGARQPHPGLRDSTQVPAPWDFVPFGLDENGAEVGWSPLAGGLLVGGQTGGGKSWLLHGVVSAFATHDPTLVQVHMVDAPKRGMDARPWKHRFHSCGFTVETGCQVVEGVRDLLRRRIDRFDGAKWVHPTPEFPAVVLIVDEFGVFHDLVKGSNVEQMVGEIAATGRAAGVFLVVATQRAQADCVPTVVRDQLTHRVAFATASSDHTRAILGGLRDTDPKPHDKRVCGSAGVGVLVAPGLVRRFGAFTAHETAVGVAALRAPTVHPDETDLADVSTPGDTEPVVLSDADRVILASLAGFPDGARCVDLVDVPTVADTIPVSRTTARSREGWVAEQLHRLAADGWCHRVNRLWVLTNDVTGTRCK